MLENETGERSFEDLAVADERGDPHLALLPFGVDDLGGRDDLVAPVGPASKTELRPPRARRSGR